MSSTNLISKFLRAAIFLPLFLFATSANADSALIGIGADTCVRHLVHIEQDKDDVWKTNVAAWAGGFLSGLNVAASPSIDLDQAASFDRLSNAIIAYCKAHPDGTIYEAVYFNT